MYCIVGWIPAYAGMMVREVEMFYKCHAHSESLRPLDSMDFQC